MYLRDRIETCRLNALAERLPIWISLEIRFQKQDCGVWSQNVPWQAHRQQHLYPGMMFGSFVTGIGGVEISHPQTTRLTTLQQVFAYLGKVLREEAVKFQRRSLMCLSWVLSGLKVTGTKLGGSVKVGEAACFSWDLCILTSILWHVVFLTLSVGLYLYKWFPSMLCGQLHVLAELIHQLGDFVKPFPC